MRYFIVLLNYEVPLERVAEVVADHRRYLDEGYAQGWFLASGPRNPKIGGLLIARAQSLEELEQFFENDPFRTQGVVSYQYIEFEPVKRHAEMGVFFGA